MPEAFLNIIEPGHESWEMDVDSAVIAIGRALDNQVCLEDDANVSRYHAEIEQRGDSFWIVDLGSSNGTTVNDFPVEFESQLRDGDLISIGGSTVIEFHLGARPQLRQEAAVQYAEPEPIEEAPVESAPQSFSPATPDVPPLDATPISAVSPSTVASPAAGGLSPLIIIGAVAGGLLLTGIVAVVIITSVSGGCGASARIVSPQSGTTVRGPVPIRLEVEDEKCIDRVVYQLDGVEVASAETPPYDIILDPNRIQGLAPGNHILSIVVEDEDGEKKVQQETILLAFGTATTTEATATPELNLPDDPGTSSIPITQSSGTLDVTALSDRLAVQITRKSGYVFDREFSELIRLRANEYRVTGYTDRARRYRREINKAFRDQGLDPLLGYILAMSRSKFNENATGEGIGVWQLPYNLVQAQGFLTAGETEAALRDPKRSAEVAAAYTKALISTFESTDDFMYVVACFGLPLSQAGQVRTQLATTTPDPIARRDFMRVVKSGVVKGDQVDRVVRFFAAGIVTENPQPFGLSSEQPFSSMF
ncbi:MAG TPA: FHA domain-containing protein [Pyrinomonadaceae bacterium]|nr:FHA domain-containing protein [Pyrinomonadaceae bacterium]